MRTRKARPGDAPAIHALIARYAAQGLLLPRSEADVRARISCFRVMIEQDRVAGCVALESYGAELAEIRSLALDPEIRGRGLGSHLVQAALAEARRRRIARVFAVTHAPEFFARLGFATRSRQTLPEKIERDCTTCPHARTCTLVAVVAAVCPERVALPVLAAANPAAAV
jgi:N-acetylglutamate synthase-like GNAT family acetyltransferase